VAFTPVMKSAVTAPVRRRTIFEVICGFWRVVV
jgi:hypothetical protein